MSSRRVGDFHLVDISWFGISVLALWASLAVTGFAQGEASIQGTVSDLSLAKTRGVLSFTPLTMLQASAQAVDFSR